MDPSWDCLIDGVSVGPNDPVPYPENNWVFCNWPDGVAGEHTLSVQVTTLGQTFWVDRIEYNPLPGPTTTNGQVVKIPYTDEGIRYGSGWNVTMDNVAKYANENGTMLEYEFIGKFPLSWTTS
jgi:hypothetical protein